MFKKCFFKLITEKRERNKKSEKGREREGEEKWERKNRIFNKHKIFFSIKINIPEGMEFLYEILENKFSIFIKFLASGNFVGKKKVNYFSYAPL